MVVQAHPKRALGRRLPRQEVIPVISLSGLVKDFGATRALDHLDLTVRRGEVHGFLGPNGAGKTTTVRILLGLLRRDAGEATVLGADPWRDVMTLHRQHVTAKVSGSGRLQVKASKSLDATVSCFGSIVYSGNPTNVTKNVSGTGAISEK